MQPWQLGRLKTSKLEEDKSEQLKSNKEHNKKKQREQRRGGILLLQKRQNAGLSNLNSFGRQTTLKKMQGLIKQVQMDTQVGAGGIIALKCDIIRKSMERTQKNLMKNIQKVQKFHQESKELAGSTESQSSVSTSKINPNLISQGNPRRSSLSINQNKFAPVLEMKHQDTERTVFSKSKSHQYKQFKTKSNLAESKFKGRDQNSAKRKKQSHLDIVPSLSHKINQMNLNIQDYENKVEDLNKQERRYCIMSGKNADYLKQKTLDLNKGHRSTSPLHLLKDLQFSPVSIPVTSTKFNTFTHKRSSAFDKLSSGLYSPPSTGVPQTTESYKPEQSRMFRSHFGSLTSFKQSRSRLQSPTSDILTNSQKISNQFDLEYQQSRYCKNSRENQRPFSSGTELKVEKINHTTSTHRPYTSGTLKFQVIQGISNKKNNLTIKSSSREYGSTMTPATSIRQQDSQKKSSRKEQGSKLGYWKSPSNIQIIKQASNYNFERKKLIERKGSNNNLQSLLNIDKFGSKRLNSNKTQKLGKSGIKVISKDIGTWK